MKSLPTKLTEASDYPGMSELMEFIDSLDGADVDTRLSAIADLDDKIIAKAYLTLDSILARQDYRGGKTDVLLADMHMLGGWLARKTITKDEWDELKL